MRNEMPEAKKKSVNGSFNAILKKLALDEEVTPEDWEITDKMVQGINDRFGGCTFDFQTALRVLLTYKEKSENGEADAEKWAVPGEYYQKIKQAFLGYRFFMTMPGEDDMVLWSENLQILCAVNEYFTARLWPDEVFLVDGKSAAEHMEHAESRINIWLRQRWLYGFTEWNSPTYYVEDVSPLCLLIDFAPDPGLRERAKIILDLILYDIAVGQYDGIFGTTAGRCYSAGRRLCVIDDYKSGDELSIYNSISAVTEEIVGDMAYTGVNGSGEIKVKPGSYNGMLNNFRYRKPEGYIIPEVIKKIARDRGRRVYRASHGLYLSELKEKGLVGLRDEQIMMQWAMESFSNPETIKNTLAYCRRHKLFNNANFKELKYFNLPPFRIPGALVGGTRLLNLFTNGIVIERANTYTYKTPYYLQATAQMYNPKSYGTQQHLWTVNLGEFAVFASNPYGKYGKGNFWISDGVKPFAAQEKNVTLAIYDTRVRGVKIRKIYRYTHAHFPVNLFDRADESMLAEGKVFGEKDGAFVALIAMKAIKFIGGDGEEDASFTRCNLVQEGTVTAWICETGDRDTESFEEFSARVSGNGFIFDGRTLNYESRGVKYVLSNKKTFAVDGEARELEYGRFESDFIQAEREAAEFTFSFGENILHHNYDNFDRRLNNDK